MLPVVNPNRNRNANFRQIPVDLARAAIIWGQLLIPRAEFDRLMRTVISASAAGATYVTYKSISSIGKYLPNFPSIVNKLNNGEIDDTQPSTKAELHSKLKKGSEGTIDVVINNDGTISNKRMRQKQITDDFKKKKLKPNTDTVLNLQEDTQAPFLVPNEMSGSGSGDGTGSGLPAGLNETPVDEVVDVERGVTSYQFASLPWNGVYYRNVTNCVQYDLAFRMTSPYDTVATTLFTDTNTDPTGVQNEGKIKDVDTIINKAMWFEYYAAIYKYYHVVSCRWKILFENLGNEPMWVHEMYVTDELPTTGASNIDMINWPDCKNHYVPSKVDYVDATGIRANQLADGWQNEGQSEGATNFNTQQLNSNRSNILQLAGQFKPGQVTREIREDSEVENWTLTSTNPSHPERLLLRLKSESERYRTASGTPLGGRSLKFKYTIQLEYLVEFKELKAGLKWPVQSQPLTVSINQNVALVDKTDEHSTS